MHPKPLCGSTDRVSAMPRRPRAAGVGGRWICPVGRPSLVSVGAIFFGAVAPLHAALKGDVNRDGVVNGADIPRFVAVLLNPSIATRAERCACDTNEDGVINPGDVAPMTELLLGEVPPFYAVRGHWDCPFEWGLPGQEATAIHTGLVPTPNTSRGGVVGKVLTYCHPGDPEVYLWDPQTGAFSIVGFPSLSVDRPCPTERPPADAYLFCSGHSILADGEVFITGGHLEAPDLQCPGGFAFSGAPFAFTFDPFAPPASAWSRRDDMNRGRWYPTNCTLADGRVLVVSGYDHCGYCDTGGAPVSPTNTDVEVYTPASPQGPGGWEVLGQKQLPLYPFMHLVSSGEVFYAGPSRFAQLFDPVAAAWRDVATSNHPFRGSGSSVLVPGATDRVMILGGDCCNQSATTTTEIIDVFAHPPVWQAGPTMNFGRTHVNAVLLPDGGVLVVGGRRDTAFGPNPDPVYAAELCYPTAPGAAWALMSRQSRPRMYHSTALLLPDGRVLSAGSTAATSSFPFDETNAEIFHPPNLFRGPRPTILSAPTDIAYGEPFSVLTPAPSAIAAVALMRPGFVTHSFNPEQRHRSLAFEWSVIPEGLTVTAPAGPALAPPGYYLLFLISDLGVPSEAAMMRLG